MRFITAGLSSCLLVFMSIHFPVQVRAKKFHICRLLRQQSVFLNHCPQTRQPQEPAEHRLEITALKFCSHKLLRL